MPEPTPDTPPARCYACGELLPVASFAPDASKASGRKSICRACDREKSAEYYAANRERARKVRRDRARVKRRRSR